MASTFTSPWSIPVPFRIILSWLFLYLLGVAKRLPSRGCVAGTKGSLTGHAGGLEKKIRLLQREGVNTEVFRIPTAGTAL